MIVAVCRSVCDFEVIVDLFDVFAVQVFCLGIEYALVLDVIYKDRVDREFVELQLYFLFVFGSPYVFEQTEKRIVAGLLEHVVLDVLCLEVSLGVQLVDRTKNCVLAPEILVFVFAVGVDVEQGLVFTEVLQLRVQVGYVLLDNEALLLLGEAECPEFALVADFTEFRLLCVFDFFCLLDVFVLERRVVVDDLRLIFDINVITQVLQLFFKSFE